ncbi:MAG: Lsm family RNA-binding protein [Desulfurococcaceae archaeon]|uniref:Ribonucleoprotein n=1 Tax=Staphylothermus marinus TaxID=2280 RepID=A0A7C4HES9_STAMA
MSVIDASRRLVAELANLVDRRVKVILVDGRHYEGQLIGIDHPTMNILLIDAVDDKNNRYPKVIIRGERISEIQSIEIPLFDPDDFKQYIVKEMNIPEHLVQIIPEAQAVVVQGRYKVTEKGVEGSGPIVDRLYQFYTKYIEERKKKLQGK